MGEQTGLIITGVLTFLGGAFAVWYKNKPKPKDRIELFFERYDKDLATLSDRLEKAEKRLDEALKSLDDKDRQIRSLQEQLEEGDLRYRDLLKRFNTLKKKYEARDKKNELESTSE